TRRWSWTMHTITTAPAAASSTTTSDPSVADAQSHYRAARLRLLPARAAGLLHGGSGLRRHRLLHGAARTGLHGRRAEPRGVSRRRRRVPAQGPVLHGRHGSRDCRRGAERL